MGNVGCSLAAAVHFSPAFCPIATAMGLQIRRKLSSLGPNFASTPQARQAPGDCRGALGAADSASSATGATGAEVALVACTACTRRLSAEGAAVALTEPSRVAVLIGAGRGAGWVAPGAVVAAVADAPGVGISAMPPPPQALNSIPRAVASAKPADLLAQLRFAVMGFKFPAKGVRPSVGARCGLSRGVSCCRSGLRP